MRESMGFKPMSPAVFERHLKIVGWHIEKGSFDWNLYSEEDGLVCTVQIVHGSKSKNEVSAYCVGRVEQEIKRRGWTWPPQKKSKKS
jgi:hypothetical protein